MASTLFFVYLLAALLVSAHPEKPVFRGSNSKNNDLDSRTVRDKLGDPLFSSINKFPSSHVRKRQSAQDSLPVPALGNVLPSSQAQTDDKVVTEYSTQFITATCSTNMLESASDAKSDDNNVITEYSTQFLTATCSTNMLESASDAKSDDNSVITEYSTQLVSVPCSTSLLESTLKAEGNSAYSAENAKESASTIGNLDLKPTSNPNNYGSVNPIPIPCEGENWVFTATAESESDIFIALTDTGGFKDLKNYLEVQLGLGSGKNNIKNIVKNSLPDSDLKKRAVPTNIKLEFINRVLKVFIANNMVNSINSKVALKTMVITPFNNIAKITDAVIKCVP